MGHWERNWEKVKAPSGDGRALVLPDRAHWLIELESDLVLRSRSEKDFSSEQSWVASLRDLARREIAESCLEYLHSYVPEFRRGLANASELSQCHWIVGGHQPELFHPGVWFKNFYIDSVAKEWSASGKPAIALHVIIDHDLAKSTSIRIPVQRSSREQIGLESLAMEMVSLPILEDVASVLKKPWHLVHLDRMQVEGFADRVKRGLLGIGIDNALIRPFCDSLCHGSPASNVALAFSQARHRIELGAGLQNLEIPMSKICESRAWSKFVSHCLIWAEKLNRVYNQALGDYRVEFAIENPGQPVPPLLRSGPWIELPFWLYRLTDLTRSRFWVRPTARGFEIAAGENPDAFLWSIETQGPAQTLADVIHERIASGICLRPRALITTLFLRVFLAEGFVHGIGGGLYDRLTDRLIEQFLNVPAPSYCIATATLMVPTHLNSPERWNITGEELQRLKGVLHDLRSRPERFLDLRSDSQRKLADEHIGMLQAMPAKGNKRSWHLRMKTLREEIRRTVASIGTEKTARVLQLGRDLHQMTLMRSREYSFLLYPREFCVDSLRRCTNEVATQ